MKRFIQVLSIVMVQTLASSVLALSQSWCHDTDDKFFIESVPYIKKKKSCAWAQEKQFIRCKIPEVTENCPVLCNFCNCLDNTNRFDVPTYMGGGGNGTRLRSCTWAGRKNSDTRCKKPVIQENCPLTCGECYLFFSTAPSTALSTAPSTALSTALSTAPSTALSTALSTAPSTAPSTVKLAFETTDELKAVAKTWCENPDAWVPGYSDYDKYGPMHKWDTSLITDMTSVFDGYYNVLATCDPPVENWNVSHVTSFQSMFSSASAFNQDISSWDVSKGTNFRSMLRGASAFNQDISSWNVSSGTNFYSMFEVASAFNQDISSWDVSSGTNFRFMFAYASAFNQDISSWDVSKGTRFNAMFYGASAFNQDICEWDVDSTDNTDNFCTKPNCGDCTWY